VAHEAIRLLTYYLRNVGRKKGDKSVSALKYVVGKTLDIKPVVTCNNGESYSKDKFKGFDNAVFEQFEKAKAVIRAGLLTPVVCMSFAGDTKVITQRKDYQDFVAFAHKRKIKVTMTVMSTTAGKQLKFKYKPAFELVFLWMRACIMLSCFQIDFSNLQDPINLETAIEALK